MSFEPQSNPTGDSKREEQLELLIADYIRDTECGRAPNRQELLNQYPEFSFELKQFFAQRDRLNRLADPIRDFADDLYQSIGPGKQLSYVGNYELLEEVARGGMGVVYKARQTTLGRIVAVKMIVAGQLANEQDVQRFQSEAQAAASLKHPNIVSIHEVGQHEGWHYFSMDFIEGHDLATILRLNLLPAKTAATYVRQMAEAIHYAHQQGILHRDLKPSNILIDQQSQIHITDFGLAMRVEANQGLTQTGQILGTPSYMPPEQAQGKRSLIGPASDVYALGAILYECLTGRPPFRAESVIKTIEQVIHAEAASPRTLNAAIPRDLETICLKCLEKEPHRRYGTAQLFAEDLARFLSGEPIIARPAHAWERSVKWIRRHPMPTALMVSSMVALLAVVGMGIGVYYNAQLDRANSQLVSSNQQLETARITLESSNQQLSLTSAKLERSVEEVKAERALARRHLYASRMALIQVAEQKGETGRIVQLLRSLIPETEEQEDLRDFEWNYLWRKYRGEEARLDALSTAVNSLAISPDGTCIATAGRHDHQITIWDAESFQNRNTLSGHRDGITDLAFSHDGRQLVSSSLDMTLKCWSVKTGAEQLTISGFESAVNAVAYGPDDKQIAGGDGTGAVRFWDANSGEELAVRKGNTQEISDLVFLPDENSLALGFGNKWSIQQASEDSSNPLHGKINTTTTNIDFDSARYRVAFGYFNRSKKSSSISVLEVKSNNTIWGITDPRLIRRIALSRDGVFVAASWDNQTIEIWNVGKGELVCSFYPGDTVRSLAFSRDGAHVMAGTEGGKLLVWSILGKEVAILGNEKRTHWIAFAGNHQVIFPSGGGASVWEVRTETQSEVVLPPAKTMYRWTATAGNNRVVSLRGKELIETTTGRNLVTLKDTSQPGSFGYLGQVSVDASCRYVAGAFASSSVDVWDATSGELLRRLDVPPMAASVALNPDGELLACGTAWFGARAPQKQVAVSDQLEICSLQVWETKTGRRVFFREEIFAGGIWDLAFSRDGKKLAVAMGKYEDKEVNFGRVRVWDCENWTLTHDLRGHAGSVWAVAFNTSGTRLASAGGNWNGKGLGQAKVWDLRTGLELLTLVESNDPIFDISFSPDSNRIATANGNGLVRLWNGAPLIQSPSYAPLAAE